MSKIPLHNRRKGNGSFTLHNKALVQTAVLPFREGAARELAVVGRLL
jgi:hypothetical protein